ncbi:hypothetical protein RRG08_048617 [Elysia crispata]|uniref:Uncharacterized protein n=1 Tax=Elysia crispata TaxID=231223 RepID=A0AAE1AD88_9GAST|nr:hypothetical protein RRG08_048617 [Elysia crispata]
MWKNRPHKIYFERKTLLQTNALTMPLTSSTHTSQPVGRTGKHRSGDQKHKDGQRRKSVSGGRHRVPRSKISSKDRNNGKGAACNFSTGFRIASTVPHAGKIAKKEASSNSTLPAKSACKGHSLADCGHFNENKCGNRSTSAGNKPRSNGPAQLTCKIERRPASGSSPTNFTKFGSSSQIAEPSTEGLPDPYLKLQNMANAEMKNLLADLFLSRTRLGCSTSQNSPCGGAAKSVFSSPSPRSPPTARYDGGSNVDRPSCRNSYKEPTPVETAMFRRSQSSCSNPDRGCKSGAREAPNRPATARRSSVSSGDGGDGYGGSGNNLRGTAGAAHTPNGFSRRKAPSSSRSTSDKSARPRFSVTGNEQEDDDDEDETGMPQAVRLPETTTDEPLSNQEILKRIHKVQMENIVKKVKPSRLMQHLADEGYFRHDYSGSARTSTDNHNLRYGMKKGVERLYLWLSMYSPSDESATTSKA